MRRPSWTAFACVCGLASLSLLPEPARSASATTIPDVHFAIFRFSAGTQAFVGLYEFSQPYRKSLPAGYVQSTNLLYRYVSPGDFGWVEVESRLTGERILGATSIWMGTGTFDYPPAWMMSTNLQHGFTNPAPEALTSPGIPFAIDVNAAWTLVQDTDAIARLAAHGTYEVYAWMHRYADGGAPPLDEVFIIAASHPIAPDDMATLQVAWPRTLVTRGRSTTPEIVVHNFGDAPTNILVRLGVTADPRHYLSTQPIGVLAADQSRTVMMPAFQVTGDGVRTFDCSLRASGGSAWFDLYPTNDAVKQSVRITDQPVFRYSSSIPREGIPCDFDGDGDIDVVAFPSSVQLWQNDGAGHFANVTGLSSFPVRNYSRFAACGDFTGDDHPDIFVSYWGSAGMMLVGDGTGRFTDATTASGVGGVTTYSYVLAVDKENDGDLDLFLAGQGQENILENDGSGHFTNVTGSSGIVDTRPTLRMAAGDLNGDGFADLAFANWGYDATVYINDGDGTFTRLNREWSLTYQRDALLFDFDGDQDDDIFFLQDTYGPSRLFQNNGGLSFSEVTAPEGGFPRDLAVDAGDFNEDGRIDLVASNGGLLMNTESAFADTSALLVELSKRRMAMGEDVHFADMDHDGDLDVYGWYRSYLNQGVQPDTSVGDTPLPPAANLLEQNFPNPFNPSTTTRYRVSTSGRVTLAIYNVAGQLVRTLVNEVRHAGTEPLAVAWDGRDNRGERVASGVYLCRLVTADFQQARKLVLLK